MSDTDEQSIPSRGSHGSGITERLRGWAKADDSVWPSELMGEAAGEIDRLRLTDEEREAVHRLCRAVTHYSAGGVAVDGGSFARDDERAVAVVRGWLARLT